MFCYKQFAPTELVVQKLIASQPPLRGSGVSPSQGAGGSPPPRGFGGRPLLGGRGVSPSQGAGGLPSPRRSESPPLRGPGGELLNVKLNPTIQKGWSGGIRSEE